MYTTHQVHTLYMYWTNLHLIGGYALTTTRRYAQCTHKTCELPSILKQTTSSSSESQDCPLSAIRFTETGRRSAQTHGGSQALRGHGRIIEWVSLFKSCFLPQSKVLQCHQDLVEAGAARVFIWQLCSPGPEAFKSRRRVETRRSKTRLAWGWHRLAP